MKKSIEESLDNRRRIAMYADDLFNSAGFRQGWFVHDVIQDEDFFKAKLAEEFRPTRAELLKRVVSELFLPHLAETITFLEPKYCRGDNPCLAATIEGIEVDEFFEAGDFFPELTPKIVMVSVDAIISVARGIFDEAHARYRRSNVYSERRLKSKRGMAKGSLNQQEYLLWYKLDEKIEKAKGSV